MKRSVRHQWLPCHRPVGVEAYIEVHTGELFCLAEYGLSRGGFRQPVPIAHLVGGEFLPALRNLLQRCPADKLRSGGCTSRPAFNGKDATAANLASRNTLSRPRKFPESDGRKCNHSLSLS